MNQTERLINRIKEVDNFNDVAELCEDFSTFVDEIQEWGVQAIAKVELYSCNRIEKNGRMEWELNQDLDYKLLDQFFSSFGYTKSNPHPAGNYAHLR